MAMKSFVLITLFVVVLVATQAEAQSSLTNVFNINGNVSCSVNGTIVVNGTTPTPPFPNALVQLSCNGIVRGLGITNKMGVFSIIVSPITFNNNVTNLLTNCKAVVVTPLSACNATLPSTGTLQAPLQFVGNTIFGLLNIASFASVPFQLIA